MLWGPRHLFAVLPFLAWGLVGLDWGKAWTRWASLLAFLLSCSINVTGAMFSDVIMSTYAFGPDLRYPIHYAFRLLAERGPRAPLLDACGADPRAQAAIVFGLVMATIVVVVVRVSREPRPDGGGRQAFFSKLESKAERVPPAKFFRIEPMKRRILRACKLHCVQGKYAPESKMGLANWRWTGMISPCGGSSSSGFPVFSCEAPNVAEDPNRHPSEQEF